MVVAIVRYGFLMNEEDIFTSPPGIFVVDCLSAFKLIRNFGHLIMDFHINLELFNGKSQRIEQYLDEYCSKSLTQITIKESSNNIFQITPKPFQNVEFVWLENCFFGLELSIKDIFPNVRVLKLGRNYYLHPPIIRMHLPRLTELFFHERNNYIYRFQESDIDMLLKLNPQLEKLVLCLSNQYDSKLIQNIKINCPNLRHFELYCCSSNLKDIKQRPIDFERIETFGIYSYFVGFTRFFQIKMHPFTADMIPSDYRYPIICNPQLTSIKFCMCTFGGDIHQIFINKSVLLNIEDLSIIQQYHDSGDDVITSESIIRFLKQNRRLKTFSLIVPRLSTNDQFYDLIMSTNDEFKIRHKAIVFTITRATDNLKMKYFIRVKKWVECYYYSQEINYFELASFHESNMAFQQKFTEYMDEVQKLRTDLDSMIWRIKHRDNLKWRLLDEQRYQNKPIN